MDMDSRQQQSEHYKIYVRMTKIVALDVKSTDTIDQIKSKIGAIEGIDNSQQALFFAGNHLEKDNRLADYNIMTNSCVDLYVTDGMQISVSIPSVGKTIKLNLTKSQSVADVKAVIEQKGGISLDEQILMYGGQKLEDDKLLSQCGLSNGHTLHVLVYPTDRLRISVDVDGERTVNLDVKIWYTVADVKLMIDTLEGLPASTQILMHTQPGGHFIVLKDTKGLFGPAPPERLLRRSRSRFGGATNCGSSKPAPAPLFFTGKRLLQENVWQGSSEGARARAEEEPCQTSPKTLQSQHVKNNDILTLHMDRTVQFFVRTLEGKTLTMMLNLSDTTKDVMKKIEERLPIKPGIYSLRYRGRALSLEDPLLKYKVESDTTIHLCLIGEVKGSPPEV